MLPRQSILFSLRKKPLKKKTKKKQKKTKKKTYSYVLSCFIDTDADIPRVSIHFIYSLLCYLLNLKLYLAVSYFGEFSLYRKYILQ